MSDEELYEDYDYIIKFASEIRDLLLRDESFSDFMATTAATASELGEYPDEAVRELVDILEGLSIEYRNRFRKIVYNEDLQDSTLQLLNAIFFGPPETYESVPDTPDESQLIIDEGDHYEEIESVLTTDSVWQRDCAAASQLAESLTLSWNVAYMLLQANRWNKAVVEERAADDRRRLFSEIGITPDKATDDLLLRVMEESDELIECDFCACEVPKREMLGLICEHWACKNCWTEHLRFQIQAGAAIVKCWGMDCECRVTLEDVKNLCGDEISETYRNFIIDKQIAVDSQLERCLNPRCNMVLTLDSVGLCYVATCSCGARMCWKCREEAHAPLSCDRVADWRRITKEDALQAKWIVENTKPCPKCHTRIEKNGGCNHMTCRTQNGGGCGYEFCWICGHEWRTHQGDGYRCNKFVDFDTLDKSNVPQGDLGRLNHYHVRYMNHLKSKAREQDCREALRSRVVKVIYDQSIGTRERLTEEEASEIVTEAFHAIDTARSVLIWSYPHAFYMAPGSTELNLFEHVQTEVERYLEEVTDLIENNNHLRGADLRQQARILAANTEVLNKHVDNYSK